MGVKRWPDWIPAVMTTTVCFRKTDILIVSAIQYNVDLRKDV